ncbi:MAG: cytochrome c [Candidatus Zixiibacteriota bacterium]
MMKKIITIIPILLIIGAACTRPSFKQSRMSEGERLFRANCRACHVLPKPDQKKADEWATFLENHPDPAALSPEVRSLIVTYLQGTN